MFPLARIICRLPTKVSRLKPGNDKFSRSRLELTAIFPHVADAPTDPQHVIDTPLKWIRRDRFRASMCLNRGFACRFHTLWCNLLSSQLRFSDKRLQNLNEPLDVFFPNAKPLKLRADFNQF
jgi:hypothetical protein